MERRSTDRVATEIGVSCRVPARPESATLVDLSRTGCQLEFGRRAIDAGATISLDFRAGRPVAGQVVWTDGSIAGVHFHSRLPKLVAVELGLEQPEREPDPETESVRAKTAKGGAHHWMRR